MMNVNENHVYGKMAEDYFTSAEKIKKLIEKFKSDKELKIKNPKEYNSRISAVRAIYNDCIQTGNILRERAEKYENAQSGY